MSGIFNSNRQKTGNHPKTHLCFALNLARHRFFEILSYIKSYIINERNWLQKLSEFKDLEKLKNANQSQQDLIEKLSIYLPFIKPENDNLEEIKMIRMFINQLSHQRNFYSHAKHKPIILKFEKNNEDSKFIKRFCDLFADGISSISNNSDEGYRKEDFIHLKLEKKRIVLNTDKKLPENITYFISKSKPAYTDNEYSLFFKSQNVFEFTEKGAMFLASLFLDKKEATEFLGGMTGFKKTDGKIFKATRDVFTFYSGKVIFNKMDTSNKDVSLLFNMVSYLNKKPECIPAKVGDEIRPNDLLGHFALRYLLMDEKDIKIRQYTGKKTNIKPPKEIQTKNGEKIIVSYSDDEKIYSGELQNKFFTTGNNIYFEYNEEHGELGFKALSQLVFAKLLRNENRYEKIFDDVKQKLNIYIIQYKAVLEQIKNGTINSKESLTDFLKGKIVKIIEIPQAIQNGLSDKEKEDDNAYIERVSKRLENKIEECDERLEKVGTERIYDIVTFILQDFMDSIGRDIGKPGRGLYKRLHNKLTFYGRYRDELIHILRNKSWDYDKHILSRALDKKDLREVYKNYLLLLKEWCKGKKKTIEDSSDNKLHIATELGTKIGLSQKKYVTESNKKEKRTSSAKDIADMILEKPIPIPDNLISNAILEKIKIVKDGKGINRLGTLIDIYLSGKGFDASRNEGEKNAMLPEYYHNIEEKYANKKAQKNVRLSKTNDKILRLIIGEYLKKDFIENKVKLYLPDDKPVTDLYHSTVEMNFFDRKIKFKFDKYNKVKRLIYDKRVETIVNFHIDKKLSPIVFSDVTDDKFIIDEERNKFKKSQKHLISSALDFEERFWKDSKNDFEALLKKYTSKTYLNHRSILKEARINDKIADFRNSALHNAVPETKYYFKDIIEKYNSFLK